MIMKEILFLPVWRGKCQECNHILNYDYKLPFQTDSIIYCPECGSSLKVKTMPTIIYDENK